MAPGCIGNGCAAQHAGDFFYALIATQRANL